MKAEMNSISNEVYLEPISKKRKSEFLRLAKLSRQFHKKWVTAPATDLQFQKYLGRIKNEAYQCFFVCRGIDQKLVGVINVSQIIRGFFQSAFLGYYVFEPFARNKYMGEGLSLVLNEAFMKLDLHRLEANIQPKNIRSKKLVKRLGFRLEGFSPKYLQVDGKWCDHERWAITKDIWETNNKKKAR